MQTTKPKNTNRFKLCIFVMSDINIPIFKVVLLSRFIHLFYKNKNIQFYLQCVLRWAVLQRIHLEKKATFRGTFEFREPVLCCCDSFQAQCLKKLNTPTSL